tara:strand:- start:209 stop:1120 length:912 start_codon:yes stop_codon:yes gene_type:complete
MTIKHLVLSGGGPAGFVAYGTIKTLMKNNFFQLDNIISIHGCSIGAVLGAVIALKYDWDWLDDYFVKRPWNKITNFSADSFMNCFSTKGFLGTEIIEATLSPLLSAKELSSSITLKEFYEYTKVHLVMYTTSLNQHEVTKIPLSYETHPDIPLVTALAMTTAIPIIFKPVFYQGECYVDGGIMANVPINDCITANDCNPDEILAIKYLWGEDEEVNITEDSSLLEFLMAIVRKSQLALCTESTQKKLLYCIESNMKRFNGFQTWISALENQNTRLDLVSQGEKDALQFIEMSPKTDVECQSMV